MHGWSCLSVNMLELENWTHCHEVSYFMPLEAIPNILGLICYAW